MRHIADVRYRAQTTGFFVKYNIIRIPTTFEYRQLYYCKPSPFAVSEFLKFQACVTLKDKVVGTRRAENWRVPGTGTNYGNQNLQFLLSVILNRCETREYILTLAPKKFKRCFIRTSAYALLLVNVFVCLFCFCVLY